jgi:ArsR family transcriptional regulator, virulence genes transcriptional regulator
MEPLFAVRWLTIYSYYRIYASMKMNIGIMEAAADRASELLKALANRHRLLIVCQLIDGERSVGDLAEFLDLRDSTVSQHLALLRKDGLVSARRDAQTIYYSIASDSAREILTALYRVYCTPPSRSKTARNKAMRA